MSAPDTNIETQKTRHRPSLIGIGAAAVFGFAMLLGLIFYVSGNADEPTAAAVTTDPDEIATN